MFLFCFFFYCSGALRHLHSFPTRRSSDLTLLRTSRAPLPTQLLHLIRSTTWACEAASWSPLIKQPEQMIRKTRLRSEEHTSELQSRGHLVCRLLLEKKKKNKMIQNKNNNH